MKTRIVVGAALLLSLGSAVAGSFIYGQGRVSAAEPQLPVAVTPVAQQQVTPEMIAMWKATAASSDYVAPRMPI
jgi:hypothetical protein